ncbi:DUF7537 family lipoprotein [Halocatena halophila]|uniref:DUF7537 family lipoprotein n=1 Tax=Halocatena halophila TaxID=2814576 RepID=UPI002ED3D68D
MRRNVAVSIGLIALLLLSGCSGLDLSGSTETETTAGTSTHTTTGTDTMTPAQIEHPDGWNETGVADIMAAYESHYRALFAHDSFTRNVSMQYLYPNQTVESTGAYDLSASTYYRHERGTLNGSRSIARAWYQTDNQLYIANLTGRPSYNSSDSNSFESSVAFFTNTPIGQSGPIYYTISSVHFSGSERIVRDGETMFKFEATAIDANDTTHFIPPMVNDSTVDSFSMTTIVDGEGLIRSAEYDITYTTSAGKTHSRSGFIKFTGLNETNVAKPDWLAEAKAN